MRESSTTDIRVDLGDITVCVRLDGLGPAVLPIPGGAAGADRYFPGLAALSGTHSIITHDRVGTGGTRQRPAGPDHLEAQGRDVAAVVEAAGRGPAVLLAHSLGGPVALQVALDRPDLVAGLVLLDPTPICGPREVREVVTTVRVAVRAAAVPGLAGVMRRVAGRSTRRAIGANPSAEVRAATDVLTKPHVMQRTPSLLTFFLEDAAALTDRLTRSRSRPKGFLVTAGRGDRHRITASHRRMADLAGLELRAWCGTSHPLHLQRPDDVVALVRACGSDEVWEDPCLPSV